MVCSSCSHSVHGLGVGFHTSPARSNDTSTWCLVLWHLRDDGEDTDAPRTKDQVWWCVPACARMPNCLGTARARCPVARCLDGDPRTCKTLFKRTWDPMLSRNKTVIGKHRLHPVAIRPLERKPLSFGSLARPTNDTAKNRRVVSAPQLLMST